METIRETFLVSMKAICPNGCGDVVTHRLFIQTYVMGWTNNLINDGLEDSVKLLEPEIVPLFAPDWRPDPSWCWWEFKPKSSILVPGKDF